MPFSSLIRTASRRALLGSALALAAAVALPSPGAFAQASDWPQKPIRIVVTFPPGGTSDIVARLIGQNLTERLGQQVLVDNRPGAGGTVAAELVRKEAPDGYTLILANNAPFTIAPTQFKKIPYDPVKDFTHIAYIGASAPGLMVQPSLGVKDLNGFVALAKADPKLTYGSSGVGSISHILGEAVKKKAGIQMVHVPYKGSAPAIQDFKAGVLKSYYDLLAQNVPMIKSGEAVAIGVAAPERISQAPDVPTFREQGLDIVLENWLGVSGPAGMPPELVAKIHDAVAAAVATPAVKDKLSTWGIETKPMTSAQYAAFVADQIAVWRPLIIDAGATEK
ncbi:Bug family tripartite tricarboxylate transporter substrate binding protein [Aquabacter spiritensis]|uniref:Tripartite-type tricarboxylate transporter receptor subunit TctC n=1 Tax=Aquabacter spiritensis TaxID=933073 RepID=A0A4V2UY61_9HYPH|nr:tripartite tricarboxylate transporter substrate binding protein [Aquabacter spiritensis]TCT06148.1 tripartite-type tricarboxylate transporter receptor subunit TctC [Aquabacter spiritensis]